VSRYPLGSREWRAQFERDQRRFDRMFPIFFVLAAVLAVGVTVTIIVLTANGTLPAWFAAWWFLR